MVQTPTPRAFASSAQSSATRSQLTAGTSVTPNPSSYGDRSIDSTGSTFDGSNTDGANLPAFASRREILLARFSVSGLSSTPDSARLVSANWPPVEAGEPASLRFWVVVVMPVWCAGGVWQATVMTPYPSG